MFVLVSYGGLFIGSLLLLIGAVMWHFGTSVPEDEDYVIPTKEDKKWGLTGVALGLILLALSTWSIFGR